MPVEFRCPQCGQMLSAPDEAAGTTGSCRFCGAAVTAPYATGGAAQLIAPAAGAAAGAPPPDGTIDLGAIISEAWQLMTTNVGLYVPAALIVVIAQSLTNWHVNFNDNRFPAETMLLLLPLLLVLMVALFPIQLGLQYITMDLLTRGTSEIPRVFAGYKRFLKLFLTMLLQGLAAMPVALVMGVPFGVAIATRSPFAIAAAALVGLAGFVAIMAIALGLSLAPMEVINRDAEPMDALRTSWDITKGHKLEIFVVQLVLGIMSMLGVIACCVGVVFTLPLAPIGQVIVYRQLRGLQYPPTL